ncbi:chemotaxis protein CheB [Azospirillum sp. INR13]|uniref:chemotaxis protein CheB n=1 Tax=Azospirillum sp. INR13 TaxID=2596919 RepID=UPI00351C5EBB
MRRAAHRERNPIDIFLGSLAGDCRERAVGIILSGSGSNGTPGAKAIKERGGFTIVQGHDGIPRHDGMPNSAGCWPCRAIAYGISSPWKGLPSSPRRRESRVRKTTLIESPGSPPSRG